MLIFVIGTGGTNRTGVQVDFDDNSVAVLCSDYFRVITTLWMFFRIGYFKGLSRLAGLRIIHKEQGHV